MLQIRIDNNDIKNLKSTLFPLFGDNLHPPLSYWWK